MSRHFIVLTAIDEKGVERDVLVNTRRIWNAPAQTERGSLVILDEDMAVEVKESPKEIEDIITYGSLEKAKASKLKELTL